MTLLRLDGASSERPEANFAGLLLTSCSVISGGKYQITQRVLRRQGGAANRVSVPRYYGRPRLPRTEVQWSP